VFENNAFGDPLEDRLEAESGGVPAAGPDVEGDGFPDGGKKAEALLGLVPEQSWRDSGRRGRSAANVGSRGVRS
jgi:hypothetical protein